MALIEINRLTKLYRMGNSVVHALDGVDLTIERGEFVAITGASGSGKSTLMHLLGCLDRPTAGTYQLDGRDVSDLSDRELAAVRNKQIGFVFQTFNLINRTTAVDNVGIPLFYARQTNTRAPAMKALERVGLADRATHNPNELSGGERQRVSIARAIVNDPPLVLADEPTGNLDSRTSTQIMEVFHRLNEQGVTVIVVTHEPEIARQAQRIVAMRDGRIVSDQRTADMPAELPPSALQTEPVTLPGEPSTAPLIATPLGSQGSADSLARVDDAAPLRPRMMRGATASLILSLVALGAWGLAATLGVIMAKTIGPVDPQNFDPTKLPPSVPIMGGIMLLCFPVALLSAILGLVFGHGARKRIRTEPGNWLGRKRALFGVIFGWLAIILPVVALAINIVVGLIRGAQPPA